MVSELVSGVVLAGGGVVVPSGCVVEPSGLVTDPSGFVVAPDVESVVVLSGIVVLSVVVPLVSEGAVAEVSSVERVAADSCLVHAPASNNPARPIKRTLRFINHLTVVMAETSARESQATFHVVIRRHSVSWSAQARGSRVALRASVILPPVRLRRCN